MNLLIIILVIVLICLFIYFTPLIIAKLQINHPKQVPTQNPPTTPKVPTTPTIPTTLKAPTVPTVPTQAPTQTLTQTPTVPTQTSTVPTQIPTVPTQTPTVPTIPTQPAEPGYALFVLEKNENNTYPLKITAYLSDSDFNTSVNGFGGMDGKYHNIKEIIDEYNKYDDDTVIQCSGHCQATKKDYLEIVDKRNPSILLYHRGNILQKLLDDYYEL